MTGFFKKYFFDKKADRIGPDIPFTHWKLHFKKSMLKLCKKKFRKFPDTAEFRPGAYAVGCSTISIGERVVIRPGSMLFGDNRCEGVSIEIEDDVLIGSSVHVYVSNHSFNNPDLPIIDQGHDKPMAVKICKGAWLGANVTVLPGVTVGENAVVGAGSVVTRDVESNTVCAGVPAKEIKKLSKDM